jgi:hypothetical protein
MAKRITALALLTTVIAAPTAAQARISWQQRWTEARFKTLDWPKDRFGEREIRLTIQAAFGDQASTATRVAECESGLNPRAYNSSSGASGIFQHLRRYWRGRVLSLTSTTGRWAMRETASVFNARANIIVAARMVQGSGWGAWSCA